MCDIQKLCEALAAADAAYHEPDEVQKLLTLLTAADALAEAAERVSHSAAAAKNGESEFTIDPQDLAELDIALRQYREAT